METIRSLTVAGVLAAIAAGPGAPVRETPVTMKRSLTLEGAKGVLAAAAAEARKKGSGGAIAVVDEGGHLVSLERLDGTFPASAGIAIGKARTAALFRRPTAVFEEAIGKGRTSMVALEDFTPLQGGVPIVVHGQVIGAVGVSGARSAQEDTEIAEAGARAVEASTAAATGVPSPAPAVAHIGGQEVAAAFAKGRPLIEVAGYKVHASRREAPGMAEVHLRDTDVIHVLEGSATLVTGGELVDGQATGPDEVRGAAIRGGRTSRISSGDVVVVPNGVPHWFKEVPGPITYYVVKVTAPEGGPR